MILQGDDSYSTHMDLQHLAGEGMLSVRKKLGLMIEGSCECCFVFGTCLVASEPITKEQ